MATDLLSGTSASTPVVAAMISLFNDARLGAGLPPMGHVAPFLYQTAVSHPNAFTDISEGSIACLSGSPETVTCCDDSFGATKGWDATSGLGSPKFDQLLKIALDKGKKQTTSVSFKHAAKLVQSRRSTQAEALEPHSA